MNKQVGQYYDKPLFGELLTITKTGIVNTCQILIDPQHDQLIHGGRLLYKYYTSLGLGDFTTLDHVEEDIKIYDAVYFNGIQLVRKGKLFIGTR